MLYRTGHTVKGFYYAIGGGFTIHYRSPPPLSGPAGQIYSTVRPSVGELEPPVLGLLRNRSRFFGPSEARASAPFRQAKIQDLFLYEFRAIYLDKYYPKKFVLIIHFFQSSKLQQALVYMEPELEPKPTQFGRSRIQPN